MLVATLDVKSGEQRAANTHTDHEIIGRRTGNTYERNVEEDFRGSGSGLE